jgi:hypothetical protein
MKRGPGWEQRMGPQALACERQLVVSEQGCVAEASFA